MDKMLKLQVKMASATLKRVDELAAHMKVLNPYQEEHAKMARDLIKVCCEKDASDISVGGVLGSKNYDTYHRIFMNNELEAYLVKRRQYWAEMKSHYK